LTYQCARCTLDLSMWEDRVIAMCRSRHSLTEASAASPYATGPDRTPSTATVASATVAPVFGRAGVGAMDRGMRASDRDREMVIALLGEHTSTGRLTLAEFEERVGGATAALTLADLDRLLVDLPVAPPPRPTVASNRRHERWRPWLSTAAICLVIWAVTSLMAGGVLYFWPFWVIVPWGLVLVAGGWSAPRRRRLVR
jgi:hypothetical protein